jgi:superfamily II DNA/RNA helicase
MSNGVRLSNKNNELLVTVYQKLLQLEYEKYKNMNEISEGPFLSYDEIEKICSEHGIKLCELVDRDLLVEYPKGWRSIHFDLIYRLVYIRNRETQRPLPLEYRIDIRSEPVPDFDKYKFNEVLNQLVSDNSVFQVVTKALEKSNYRGLSSYQLPIIKELLSKKSKFVTAAIVAPTASGKTLTFFLPVIIRAVERSLENRHGLSSILVYPRKALARDQLQNFLRIIDFVNMDIRTQKITIGIDDGDTKRFSDVQEGETYREMKCIACEGSLIIHKKAEEIIIKCNKCSKEYTYLLASKDEIWKKKPTILITNVHTIYRRLLDKDTVKMLAGVDFVVFDEAHVYTDYLGGHVFYIIKLLRHATRSNSSKPYFIFSSATIPNPLEFIANLARVKKDEIFYIEYEKTLERIQGINHRLILNLYLLPHPDSSVETLTEAIILAVTLWCHKHNMKSITFIDSVAEISTISDYIHTTILGHRQGREVTDHIYNTVTNLENNYSWYSLVPTSLTNDQRAFTNFIIDKYKKSIDIHYGQLSLQQRVNIERKFLQGDLKLLLSTSTLELGIDISDVAIIIQHKLPITPESIVQRIGRAGRNNKCLRVAMGIIVLQTSPLSTLYMFDDKLRGKLADPNLLPPVLVGQASVSIKLQHTISLLLYKRALEYKETYISNSLRAKDKAIEAVKDIIHELNDVDKLITLNKEIGLFDDKDLLDHINELKSLLSERVKTVISTNQNSFNKNKEEWEEILNDVENNVPNLERVLQYIKEVKHILEKIQDINVQQILNELRRLEELLSKAHSLCINMLKSAKQSYNSGNRSIIQRWYKENSSVLKEITQIPDNDEISRCITLPLTQYYSKLKESEKRYGFSSDELLNKVTSIAIILRKGLANFLNNLSVKADSLQSVNLEELIIYESFRRIEDELKYNSGGINVIDVINQLLLNKRRFSLLLDPPSAELQLVGVNEV